MSRSGAPAAALAAALALAACSGSPSLDPVVAAPAELVVTRGALADQVVLTGELDAADSDELSVPRTSTWQLSVRWIAPEGSRVKAGDRLFELDNSGVTQRLAELELAIVRAENELAGQQARDAVTLADKELEVERQRVEVAKAELDAAVPRTLLPLREWQENQLKLERARTAHASAIDDLTATRKAAALERDVKTIDYDKAVRTYERTHAELDALVLTAPRDGVLVVADHPWFGRRLQVGDMVQPGFGAVKVSNLATMKVVAQLSDVDDGRVSAGMEAGCVLDAYPDRVFRATIEAISEIAREASARSPRRFFEVTLALEHTDTEVMRPGMSVRVDVAASVAEGALIAPREGLVLDDGPPRARLFGGGEREIELGLCTARACVVEAGLAEGDRLRHAETSR